MRALKSLLTFALALSSVTWAKGTVAAPEFVGAERCGHCHEAEYQQWRSSGHAVALARLTKVQQRDASCRACHTMAPSEEDPSLAGVQCESCHGTNPKHAEDPKANQFPRLTKDNCIVCHNKEQTRKEFNFAVERRQIACPKG